MSRNTNSINDRNANIFYSGGSLEQLSAYICPNGNPLNFVICGDNMDGGDKYRPLCSYLDAVIGRMPVIVIHNDNPMMEQLVEDSWNYVSGQGANVPLWIINPYNQAYEPFYGMTDMQVVSAMRQIAKSIESEVTARFDRVVRAHLRIIRAAGTQTSLSWLYYLSSFDNMYEFQQNVLSLPCPRQEADGIWADLCTDSMEFDLFRSVVHRLAEDACRCGWNSGNSVAELNCLAAIKNNAVMTISVNPAYTEAFLSYLAEELKPATGSRFALLFDNIPLNDSEISTYIINNNYAAFGFVSDNIVNSLGDESTFGGIMEKMHTIIIFKHGTGMIASKLSNIIGNYEQLREETSFGKNKDFGKLFAKDYNRSTRLSYQDTNRVTPQDIMNLGSGQAIIYDTINNGVIFYN